MPKRLIVLLLTILLTISCSSTGDFLDLDKGPLDLYFQGTVVKRWNKGVAVLTDQPDAKYFGDLFYLYLSLKYKPIRSQIEKVILEYLDKFDCDFSLALAEIQTEEHVKAVFDLYGKWDEDDKISFIKTIFKSETSKIKSIQLEFIGRSLLSFDQLMELYESGGDSIKIGVIGAVGYSVDSRTIKWLTDKLLDENEEIAASVLFALSKYGNVGFKLIADNLLLLPLRLKLSAIDLLTFNKEDRVLLYYSELLLLDDELLTSSILKSYKTFGKKADVYVIEMIPKVKLGLKKSLFDILRSRDYRNHFDGILTLIDDSDLRTDIIDLFISKDVDSAIKSIMVSDDSELKSEVVERAIVFDSDIILHNEDLSEYTLEFLLNNFEVEKIKEYLRSIGFNETYIRDYELINSINNSLKTVLLFESKNGEEGFVTSFFEMEQNRVLAEREESDFYSGLENWLKTGDDKYLDQSVQIKESSDSSVHSTDEEMNQFLESISGNERESIELYKDARLRIVYDYRKLSYRLKSFGEYLIISNNYKHLID